MKLTPAATQPRRAIIIGASLAGLFAATLLRKAGWQTDVYERSDVELFGRGAGITTHDELIDALAESGAELKDLGVTIHDRIAIDQAGKVLERLPYEQIVTSWDRLHQVMRATIPAGHHHLGCNLANIEQDDNSVTAVFSNGERVTADLLVGADGYRSTVRQIVEPETQPIYAGYVVWRGLAEEAEIPDAAREAIFNTFAFFTPPQNKNIGYPIAGADNDLRPMHRRYNWVWYRRADPDMLKQMLYGSDGVQYEVAIPPPKIRQELIEELKRDANRMLPEPMLQTLGVINRLFFTPIYDHIVKHMVHGRVAIIGDAAAVCRPHIGMGIAKAAADAQELAHQLTGNTDLMQGLARFESVRLPISARSVARGRDLGEYMVETIPAEEGMKDPHWREFHTIHGILKHTASSHFLREAA